MEAGRTRGKDLAGEVELEETKLNRREGGNSGAKRYQGKIGLQRR
jgi:hypothetical protein